MSLFQWVNLYAEEPKGRHHLRFRRADEFAPLLLMVLLGFQHMVSALTAVLFPALFFAGTFPQFFHYCTFFREKSLYL